MKVELSPGDWKEVEDLRVVDLRLLLGKYELSKTGTKPVLMKRLLNHLEEVENQEAPPNAPQATLTPEKDLEMASDPLNLPLDPQMEVQEPPIPEKDPERASKPLLLSPQPQINPPEMEVQEPQTTPMANKESKSIISVEKPLPPTVDLVDASSETTQNEVLSEAISVEKISEASSSSQKILSPTLDVADTSSETIKKEVLAEVNTDVLSGAAASIEKSTFSPESDSPLMLEADLNEFKGEVEEEVASNEDPHHKSKEKSAIDHKEEEKDEKSGVCTSAKEDDSNSNGKQPEEDDSKEKMSNVPKPTIPFRKLTKSVSKEDRKQRPWSDPSSSEDLGNVEAVSTESLKDIIPDMKPLLETCTNTSLLGEDDDEKEEMEDDQKQDRKREHQTEDDIMEKEIKTSPSSTHIKEDAQPVDAEASPSKRPRIDAPLSSIPSGPEDEDRSEVLLIRNLVRPFTLKQLRELLERTGTLEDFWINKIKSHCFVRFSKVEEAMETQKALDDVKWPSSNPKQLSVSFSTREKMKETAEENSSFDAPTMVKKEETAQKETSKAEVPLKENTKEKSAKEEKPRLLDDLFRRTKATPHIYWTMNEKSLRKVKDERNKVEISSS